MIKKFVLEYVLKTCWIKVLQKFFWTLDSNFSLIPSEQS